MRVIDRIRVPALIITAEDDPFVPAEPFHDPLVAGNPSITVKISAHGGHCAFVEPPPTSGEASADKLNSYDGYFAERIVVDFLKEHI